MSCWPTHSSAPSPSQETGNGRPCPQCPTVCPLLLLLRNADDDEAEDELFAPFRRQAAAAEAAAAKRRLAQVDPTVNLAADSGERFTQGAAGFGAGHDARVDPARLVQGLPLGSIARDVNRHAAAVLEGLPEGLAEASAAGGGAPGAKPDAAAIAAQLAAALQARAVAAAAAVGAAGAGGSGPGAEVPPETRRLWQQRAAVGLDDLRLDDSSSRYDPLTIEDPRLYYDQGAKAEPKGEPGVGKESTAAAAAAGQKAAGGAGAALADGAEAAAGAAAEAVLQSLAGVDPWALPNPPCDPGLARAVLLELSQEEDEATVREFGPVAAAALASPPTLPQVGVVVGVTAMGHAAACHSCCTTAAPAWVGGPPGKGGPHTSEGS